MLDVIAGLLQSVDGYMNIALEQTREIVNGRVRREYGDAFIRGNNGRKSFKAAVTRYGMLTVYDQSCTFPPTPDLRPFEHNKTATASVSIEWQREGGQCGFNVISRME